ncbi:TetR/AcrR family transcriptional regulator [Allokutzneria oryzae]|uniref:TetR/AcrR family transcriptional regulator n=1 Tax=Allokutzneria oryzae TaxID=1378989 RepID=A0ABV6A2T5_9PSEU
MAPREDLREDLVAAAERLVARRGVAGLTVREIAREAGVATGLLYKHFAGKEELVALGLYAHFRSVDARLGDRPGPAGAGTVEANLRAYVTRALVLHEAVMPAFAGLPSEPGVRERFAALLDPATGGSGLREDIADYLGAERALGRIAEGTNVGTVATMIIGACHELVLPRPHGAPAEVPPEFADELVETILNGIL